MTYTPDERFAWFLEEFGEPNKQQDVSQETVSFYRNKLPNQLLTYWKYYGFCSFKDGLFSIVNPDDYKVTKDIWLGETQIAEKDEYHVIAKTGYGDLLLWGERSGNDFTITPRNAEIFSSKGEAKRISEGKSDEAMQGFFATKAPERVDKKDVDTGKPIFDDAVKKFGSLATDEMFTFEPALFLGGEQTLKTVNKVNIFVQLELLAKMGTPQIMDINGLAKKAFG